jgi:biotin transporter BioY
LSGRHVSGIPFTVTPAEYAGFAFFSERNPCNLHAGLLLRKLCKKQGGMLMLGCSMLISKIFFLLLGFQWLKKRKRKSFTLHSVGSFSMNQLFKMLL